MTRMPDVETTPPHALGAVLARLSAQLSPLEVWLFGSRARGDARPDSDWDLLAVVDDGAPDEVVDPLFAWETARTSDVPVTLLVTRRSELAALWGRPNAIGWVIANEGIRLRGGCRLIASQLDRVYIYDVAPSPGRLPLDCPA